MFDRCQNISLGKTEENMKMVILSIRMNEYSTNMNTAYELALPIGSPLMAVSIFIPVLTISRESERGDGDGIKKVSHEPLTIPYLSIMCSLFCTTPLLAEKRVCANKLFRRKQIFIFQIEMVRVCQGVLLPNKNNIH